MKMNITPVMIDSIDSIDNISLTNESGSGDYGSFDVPDERLFKKSLHIIALVFCSLAVVLGVPGNGLVIWAISFKMKKTVNTVWYLNLAVADFLVTVFLPLTVVHLASDLHWPFGKFMCKMNFMVKSLNLFASIYILMMISVDRCVCVVWPVWARNHRSVRKASYVSLGVWVLTLIFSAPYFVFRDTTPSPVSEDAITCFNNFSLSDDHQTPSEKQRRQFHYQAVTITCFLLGFVVPFTVIVSCYVVIIHRLRRNRTLLSQSGRTFKVIAAVIIAFFLCWAPYQIISMTEMVNNTAAISSPALADVVHALFPTAFSLAAFNSCLNPLLYFCMGQDINSRVHKSILKVLENAFQEETSDSRTDRKSVDGQREESTLNTELQNTR